MMYDNDRDSRRWKVRPAFLRAGWRSVALLLLLTALLTPAGASAETAPWNELPSLNDTTIARTLTRQSGDGYDYYTYEGESFPTGLIAAHARDLDGDHAQEYLDNAESYKQQLAKLDEDYQAMISSAKRTYLVFGGRFSYGYLMRRYHLTYDCAYDSCSAATEPSVKVMARLIDDILKNDLPAVYHEELASTAVTDALCEQTGAKSLLLHSAHNLSAEDMQAGKTFLDVMYDNLESLREGLN